MTTSLIILLAAGAFMAHMHIRNYWVFKTRNRWITEGVDQYDKVVSYDYMMVRFWDWSRDIKHWIRK